MLRTSNQERSMDLPVAPAGSRLLKRLAFPPGLRAAGHGRLGLGFGLLLGYRAAGDGDDAVLKGGDLSSQASPDADGEALVDGFAYHLLVLHLVALGDERRSRREQTSSQGHVDARNLANQGDDAFFGALCLYLGVLLALPALRYHEERVRHPPHVGVARAQLCDGHVVQVGAAVQDREVAGVLDVEARDPEYLTHRGAYRDFVDLRVHLLAVHGEELGGEGFAEEERVVDVQ